MQTVPHKPPTEPIRVEQSTFGTQILILVNDLTGLETGGAPITAYVIEMDSAGGGSGPWTVISDSLVTQKIVTGLTQGDQYFFRYSAKNAHGTGQPSNVYFTLMATVPDLILPSATRTVNNDVNVIVSWDATANTRGSDVTAYRVTIYSVYAVGIEQEVHCKGTD